MIRFEVAVGIALLAGLCAPPRAHGQDAPPAPPAEKAAQPAETKDRSTSQAFPPVDPAGFRYHQLYVPRLEPGQEKAEAFPHVDPAGFRSTQTYVRQHEPGEEKADLKAARLKAVVDFMQLSTWATTHDAVEANYGLKLADADDALRAQLELPADQGVVVIAIKPGSLAEHAGLKPNDVLVSLGDQKAADVAAAKKVLLGLGQDTLEVKLIREGKSSRMSLVGPDHGFPPEAAQYWIGVPVSPVDATLRAHLPSLAADTGLIVNDVVKGSPAEAAGVQKNDVLVTLGGKALKTSDHLIEQIQAAAGKPVPLELLRAAKAITLTVTPAKRSHPTTIRLREVRQFNPTTRQYRLITPQLGVETTPESKYGGLSFTNPNINQLQRFGGYAPIDLQLHVQGTPGTPEGSTARIEAQLAEMSSKLDEIRKILDGIRKPEGK